MIEALLTVLPSICWILYRCFKLLRRPVEQLVEDLHMEIPHAPTICIDSVTETSVVIHWDIETRNNEYLYYVVLINNKEAATVGTTSCTLENLLEKKLYQLQILVVNANNNYRSQSAPVYIQTLGKSHLFPFDGQDKPIPLEVDGIVNGLSLDITPDQVKNIESDQLLGQYLAKFQSEVVKLSAEVKEYEEQCAKDISLLTAEIHQYKKEYESEADSKHKKDVCVKDLEKKKDQLVYQKMKLWNQLKGYKSSETIYKSKLEDLATKYRKLKERQAQIVHSEASERAKIEAQIAEEREKILDIKQQISAASEGIKNLTHEKREIMQTSKKVSELVLTFMDSDTVVNKDGTLNGHTLDALVKIFEVKPDWQAEVMTELLALQGAELEWKATFKAAINKYVALYNSLEIAKANKHPDYVPNRLTEFQASIEFGGFSNALPKPQRGRRTTSGGSHTKVSPSPEPEYAVDASGIRNMYARQTNDSDLEPLRDEFMQPYMYRNGTPPIEMLEVPLQSESVQSIENRLDNRLENRQPAVRPAVQLDRLDRLENLPLDMFSPEPMQPLLNPEQSFYNFPQPPIVHSAIQPSLSPVPLVPLVPPMLHLQRGIAPTPMWNDSSNLAPHLSNNSTSSLNTDMPGSRFGFARNLSPYNANAMQTSISTGPATSMDTNAFAQQRTNPLLSQPFEMSSTLWNNDRMYAHSRDGSTNNSQIWRHEPATLSKEFLPFPGRRNSDGENWTS